MSKVTIVHYGFVIPKNKCIKKKSGNKAKEIEKKILHDDLG
jgi:hypothetical protein